ncbi:unnamed protein product [Spirodela intermedia]|uniref:X8 domain-containing protein n=1 Tax=Spirodela intermedia TaxID=51605 RepID=A0A7I8IM09_SPIIN|nr:unnamed protein product [Spirodela intermedia]CAA6658182.1 unnamed protein product [Spirodela intermedia]
MAVEFLLSPPSLLFLFLLLAIPLVPLFPTGATTTSASAMSASSLRSWRSSPPSPAPASASVCASPTTSCSPSEPPTPPPPPGWRVTSCISTRDPRHPPLRRRRGPHRQSSAAPMLLPAILNLAAAVAAAGLDKTVKISTPHSFSVIPTPSRRRRPTSTRPSSPPTSSPPPLLSDTAAPLMLNLYPYYVLTLAGGIVPLDSALFRPLPPGKEEVDPNTLLHYTNLFDAMIDAAYFSLRNLNFSGVPVLVTETGWPHGGDSRQEPHATAENADAYNSNLIRHLLLERARHAAATGGHAERVHLRAVRRGPARGAGVGDEVGAVRRRRGAGVPAACGGQRGVPGKGHGGEDVLRGRAAGGGGGEDAASGAGLGVRAGEGGLRRDSAGGACYAPNSVRAHSSYAFDSYYQRHGKAAGSCSFHGAAMVTTTDPSHGRCIFPGR